MQRQTKINNDRKNRQRQTTMDKDSQRWTKIAKDRQRQTTTDKDRQRYTKIDKDRQ